MALTANVMHGEPQRCQEAGMDGFAAKPTTIPLLAALLDKSLLRLPPSGRYDQHALLRQFASEGSFQQAQLAVEP